MTETGRPYPLPPGPQSNQIGSFEIGISPTGTIIPFDYWQTIISQYGNSPILTQLIGDFDSWVDQTQNFDSFYSNIWNLPTAIGFGLDIWGRITGIPRNVVVAEPLDLFSFDDPLRGFDTAGALIYVSGPLIYTINVSLADSDYRNLIYAKAAANICNGSVPGIMVAMNTFFGNYNTSIFINESNNNNMAYSVCQVGRAISLTNLAILDTPSLPVKPAGVCADYYVVSQMGPMFGFDIENTQIQGFDQGFFGVTPLQYILSTV